MSLDDSHNAWGGCLHLPTTDQDSGGEAVLPAVVLGACSALQVEYYIHVLKMRAVLNTLTMFPDHLQHKVAYLHCNNKVVVSAMY